MARYVLSTGRVSVTARSAVHDTTAIWPAVSGTIDFDQAHPEKAAAEVRVDMRVFDAGDALKNWKMRSHLEPEKHPFASFRLHTLEGMARDGDEVSAEARGAMDWRGRTSEIRARGSASVDAQRLRAEARFVLDLRALGIAAPRVLMFRIEDVVEVHVELSANALLA